MENGSWQEHDVSATPEVLPFIWGASSLNRTFFSLVAALFVLLVITALTKRKSRERGNLLLLVGPPDSGKTAIFSTLAYDQTLPSHMSLQTNSADVVLSPSTTLRVVDVPGHPRIRGQFREHLGDARAVAFVVDASTISRNGHAVAEHLHHVLHAIVSLPPSRPTPSLVILAHKTDLLKSGTSSSSPAEVAITRVRTILERELENRKASQAGGIGVESLGAEGETSELGGLECSGAADRAFRFSEWEGGNVDFVATWVKASEGKIEEDEDGLTGFKHWLEQSS